MAELQPLQPHQPLPPPRAQPSSPTPQPLSPPQQSSPQPSPPFKHIVRVANVDLPGNKQVRWALTAVKGIGIDFADALCNLAEIPRATKAGHLQEQQVARLNSIIANPLSAGLPVWMCNRRKDQESGENRHLITGTLTFTTENDVKLLKKIRCYRGVRHIMGQPVRGQRTRSNFRKMKGKVVGVVKKKAAAAQAAAGKEEGKKKEKK